MILKGYWYVFCCASSFGSITTLAKLTYNEGASPQTVVFLRILTGSVLMGGWVVWSHKKKSRPAKEKSRKWPAWPAVVAVSMTGFSIAIMSLGYLGSVKYIPVSLSVLLFFTFPFMVILINYLMDREVLGRLKLFAFVLAFLGLALTLGPSWDGLDWRGVALVLGGALGSAGMITGSAKALRMISMRELVFLSNTGAALIVGAIVFITDSFALPQTAWGWAGIFGICSLFFLGQLFLFAATRHIGSAQTSVLLNLEPLISIGAAILLLGERLELSQFIGVAVVLLALFLASDAHSGHTQKFPVDTHSSHYRAMSLDKGK